LTYTARSGIIETIRKREQNMNITEKQIVEMLKSKIKIWEDIAFGDPDVTAATKAHRKGVIFELQQQVKNIREGMHKVF